MSTTLNGQGLAGGVINTGQVFDPSDSGTQGFLQGVTFANGPSGTATVAGSFSGAGVSALFSPIAGRDFNVSLAFASSGLVNLERSFDNGASWFATDSLSASDSSVYSEPESGVLYRLNCTAAAGAITYRMSQ